MYILLRSSVHAADVFWVTRVLSILPNAAASLTVSRCTGQTDRGAFRRCTWSCTD